MKRVLAIIGFLLVLFLATACGGGSAVAPEADEQPAAVESAGQGPAGKEPADEAEAPADEAAVEGEAAAPEATEGAAGEEPAAGTEAQASGIDPETGLEINPEVVGPGSEFIVRGEIISMNLTPQDRPEFVVKAPSGQNYRIATQALSDIYFEDGETQLAPYEYRQGMRAQATAMMPADAGPSDVLQSSDFMLLGDE